MALAGPRLDRPSAVGDEGRARTVSLWIASAVVVGIVGYAGYATGMVSAVTTVATMVGLTVAGVALVERERFGLVLVGHLLYVLFGGMLLTTVAVVLFVGLLGLGALGADVALLAVGVIGLVVALLGIGLAWADVNASEAFQHLAVGTLVTYLSMLVSLVPIVLVLLVPLFGGDVVEATTGGLTPAVSLAWFVIAVGYAAAAVRVALWRLPVFELLPPARRSAVAPGVDTAETVSLGVTLATPLALLAVLAGVGLGAFDALAAVAPPVARLLDALAWPPLLGLLGMLGTALFAVALVATLVRVATRRFSDLTVRLAGAAGAGVTLAVVLVLTVATVLTLPTLSALINVVLVGVAVGLVPPALFFVTGVGAMAAYIGLFPDRAGGPAIAAAGLVVAAVGFGGAPAPLVFACVAGAAVVWDTSWFGLGLTAELGHVPDTRRLELFHGVVAVGLGLVTVGVLYGLDLLRRGTFAGVGGTVAVLLAGVGALFLLFTLRG